MDPQTERRQRERVLGSLGNELTSRGFTRTKSTWYVRVNGDAAEFIHVHKFTFGPYFRVHAGRRLLDDVSEHVVLNGPDSDQIQDWRYLLVPKRKYDLTFAADARSMESCVRQMMHFCTRVAEPWFRKQRGNPSQASVAPSEATERLLRLDKLAQQGSQGDATNRAL
jgi:hypothetical protein